MTALFRSVRTHATFESLHNRHFRWFWLGRLATSATYQIGTVAQGWLVYQLTGSAFALGWVSAGSNIATLTFSLFSGALCDRIEKQHLLVSMRAAMVVNTLLLASVIALGHVQVWHVAANSLVAGILMAFMMPAEQAILAELVDRDTLLNAVSLSSVGMGLMGIFAASATGLTIKHVGVQGAYFAMAALYVMALYTRTRLPLTGKGDVTGNTIWSDLREGLGYLRVCPSLLLLLGIALARVILAMPYKTFLPKYAEDVLGFDAVGLGILSAAPGVGALVSALVLASLGRFRNKGKILLGAGLIIGPALVAFANIHWFPSVLFFLIIVGGTDNACMVMNQTLLQVTCENRFRGRVMSMYMWMWGLTALGTMPAGWVADRLGVPLVITLQGGLLLVAFSAIALFKPAVKRLE